MTNFLPSQFFDIEPTTVDTLREKFRKHMDMLKKQTVYEHTLYKKWKEVQEYSKMINKSEMVKANIWIPTDIYDLDRTIEEIEALQPTINYLDTSNEQLMNAWLMLRVFVSSMRFDQNPGRMLKFLITDKVTGKYLGLSSISSDVISMAARDKWIGWSREVRINQGKLKNSAIGTCIVPMQPLGYNMLGGKLIASILTTKNVREAWQSVTDNPLVGLTTTSLYGAESMYNGIPYWKTLGETQGKIFLKPDDEIYKEWHHWIKVNHKEEYQKATVKEDIVGPVTGVKQKIIDMIFKYSGDSIKSANYTHGFARGVFYAPLYDKTLEYLRGEVRFKELTLTDRVAKDVDGVVEWWKKKAIKRYKKLHKENRLKPEVLYYNHLIGVIDFEEAKQRCLGEIGR